MKSDFEWFVENYSDFQEQYGNSFLTICDKKVIGSFDDVGAAVRNAQQTGPSCIVQEVSVSTKAYVKHFYSPRFCKR